VRKAKLPSALLKKRRGKGGSEENDEEEEEEFYSDEPENIDQVEQSKTVIDGKNYYDIYLKFRKAWKNQEVDDDLLSKLGVSKAKAEELFNKEWRDIDEDDRICFKHFLNQIKSKKDRIKREEE